MNVKRIKIIVLSIAALLTVSSPVLYAYSCSDKSCRQEKGVKCKMETGRQGIYKDLNLSDEQNKALEENKNKHRDGMKALFGEVKEKKASIRGELQKGELDMAKITQLNNDLKKLEAQMLDRKLEGILEVRKILTPEQFKKFMAKMEKKTGHFKPNFQPKRD